MSLILFLTSGGGPQYVSAACSASGDLATVPELRPSVTATCVSAAIGDSAVSATAVTALQPTAAASAVCSSSAALTIPLSAAVTAAAIGNVAGQLYNSAQSATTVVAGIGDLQSLPTVPAPLLPVSACSAIAAASVNATTVPSLLLTSLCEVVAQFVVTVPSRSGATAVVTAAGRATAGAASIGSGRSTTGSVTSGNSRN